MTIIDLKDRKILFYLLQDSRQSLKSIGKKVGMSKELVSYRIKRLTDKEIIKNFNIIVNFLRLGYTVISTHYKFVNINPQIKEEIVNHFIENKNTFYVSLIDGRYDLQVDSFCGDLKEYESYLDDMRIKYHRFLKLQHSMIPIKVELFNFPFLLNESVNRMESLKWPMICNMYAIDDLDFKILIELSKDSRIPTKFIAKNLKTTVSTVSNRVQKLIEKGVILQYTINVNWLNIGYRWFHLQINLNDFSKKNLIINHMKKSPYLIRIYDLLIPDVDIHFTLLLQNMDQLRTIIEDLTKKFPNVINDHQFYSTFRIVKHNFMVPKILKIKNVMCVGYLS